MTRIMYIAQSHIDRAMMNCFPTWLLQPRVASCRMAMNLSNRFAIIVGRQKWAEQMQSTVNGYGFEGDCAGFYPGGLGVNDFQADHAKTNKLLTKAGRSAIENGHAEAIILGCTLEIGFHETMEKELGVPVIDVSIAALKEAEYAVELKANGGWKPSRKWSCEASSEAEIAAIRVFDQDDLFGNRIVIPA